MRRNVILRLFALAILAGISIAGSGPLAHAQDAGGTGGAGEAADSATGDAPKRVRVGVHLSPPFVMRSADGYTGMAVELWENITKDLNVENDYVQFANVRELVDAAAKGEVDAAVTNLSITRKRAEIIDFTQPWYDGGLRIMVDGQQGAGFRAMVRGLRDAGYLRSYAWIGFVILLATVLLTIFDRRFDKNFPKRWRDGIAESFYTVMQVAMSGRMNRKNLFGWIGRIWSGVWLVIGVAILAYVTSTVTSVMTTIALTNQINSVGDLPGKRIGVLHGTTAQDLADAHGVAVQPYSDIDEAVAALLADRIDAIVADGPVLEYYAFTNPEDPVEVVGPIFEPDKYGFGISHTTNLARPVTLEILDAAEEDYVEELREKYFGERS